MNIFRIANLLSLLLVCLFFFGDQVFAKERKKKAKSVSHRFFAFDEAPYFTSPDKRIGVKMLIDSVKVGPTLVAMQHITFLPKAHIPSHRHVFVTESIFVLKGNLTLRIDQEIKVMGPESTAYIPPKTFHEYLNDSGDVCQFIQYYSPSGPEEEFRNWEIPGEKKEAIKIKPPGTELINVPPRPQVPGTPMPVLGSFSKTGSTQTGEYQLEFKSSGQASQPVPLPKKPRGKK